MYETPRLKISKSPSAGWCWICNAYGTLKIIDLDSFTGSNRICDECFQPAMLAEQMLQDKAIATPDSGLAKSSKNPNNRLKPYYRDEN